MVEGAAVQCHRVDADAAEAIAAELGDYGGRTGAPVPQSP